MPTNPVPKSPRVPGSGTSVVVRMMSPLPAVMVPFGPIVPLRVISEIETELLPEPFTNAVKVKGLPAPPGWDQVPETNVPVKTVPVGRPDTEPFKVIMNVPPGPIVPGAPGPPVTNEPVEKETVPRLLPPMAP